MGGQYGSTPFKTGARYNPVTMPGTATATLGAPGARSGHSAVWTGSEMIVWGGSGSSPWLKTGGRYNPATNTWKATSKTGAPSPRDLHTAVWTGSRMVVWGGATATFDTNTGGRYNPATNKWTPMTTVGAPEARNAAAGVWTGSKVLIWGGSTYDGTYKVHRTGGLYDPVANTWTPTSLTNAPSAREFFAYAWTGTTFIVWGGCTDDPTCGDSTYTGWAVHPEQRHMDRHRAHRGAERARQDAGSVDGGRAHRVGRGNERQRDLHQHGRPLHTRHEMIRPPDRPGLTNPGESHETARDRGDHSTRPPSARSRRDRLSLAGGDVGEASSTADPERHPGR